MLIISLVHYRKSNASHALPGLLSCIDRLPKDKLPKLVRGDCGFGTDPVMQGLEERGIPYLFKLRLSKNVKRYIQKVGRMRDKAGKDAKVNWH